MMSPIGLDERARAGQAIYTKRVLALYDVLVHGVSNPLIWGCPTARLRALYQRHLSPNHLDVGIGTGYFLDRAAFPSASPRLTLVDANRNSLDVAARRLARYRPTLHQANILEPFEMPGPAFDSIGLMYVLHCLPERLATKAIVFDHLTAHLAPSGVLFGATILSGGVQRRAVARRLMAVYNRKGIFSNREDDADTLRTVLAARYEDVEIEIAGCVALFAVRGGKTGREIG